jgi:hypothetical protein
MEKLIKFAGNPRLSGEFFLKSDIFKKKFAGSLGPAKVFSLFYVKI